MNCRAGCVWCGLTVDTATPSESLDVVADHVMRCEQGPVNACIEVLQECSNPYVVEKAKEAIRRRIYGN